MARPEDIAETALGRIVLDLQGERGFIALRGEGKMDFEPGAAIVAGLIGGGVMLVFLYMGMAMMPNQMRMNLLLMLGTMMLPAGVMAYAAGLMMHAAASIAFFAFHEAYHVGQMGFVRKYLGFSPVVER